jgi:peptidoglycan-associated lipoprotein
MQNAARAVPLVVHSQSERIGTMIQKAHADNFQRSLIRFLIVVMFGAILALGGCKKKTVATPPATPPPPAAPTASISVDPAVITAGQSSTLTWHSENATGVTLDGQTVDADGTKTVSPTESTTYNLNAKGPGGMRQVSARVTVTPTPPPPPQASPSDEELFGQNIKHIFFDYDKYEVRPDQQSVLQGDAQWLMQHPNVSITIEGHCDERGSIEYNVALGDSRASSVKNALVQAGIAPERIRTVSYGKEKPFCTEPNEPCWEQNRRGYFVYQK